MGLSRLLLLPERDAGFGFARSGDVAVTPRALTYQIGSAGEAEQRMERTAGEMRRGLVATNWICRAATELFPLREQPCDDRGRGDTPRRKDTKLSKYGWKDGDMVAQLMDVL